MQKIAIPIIISGGQTGVDRAALDFALSNNIPCGGWCPKGRLSEDGRIPNKYPLKETVSTAYPVRTRKNIVSATGTLIIVKDDYMDRGTTLTLEICRKLNKPFFVASGSNPNEKELLIDWLAKHQIKILNIAGCRASAQKEIFSHAMNFLNALFNQNDIKSSVLWLPSPSLSFGSHNKTAGIS